MSLKGLLFKGILEGFPGGSDSKESACNAGDLGWIPGLGRSPGERKGYAPQYSCLENSMDRGAWQATVHGSQRVGHDWATFTFTLERSLLIHTFAYWGNVLSVFGKSAVPDYIDNSLWPELTLSSSALLYMLVCFASLLRLVSRSAS